MDANFVDYILDLFNAEVLNLTDVKEILENA